MARKPRHWAPRAVLAQLVDLDLGLVRRYLRPLRVFVIATILGLLFGLLLLMAFKPLLEILEQALFYRITKPLELVQGPLSGILGTKEAATAVYLLGNNLLVSFVAAFGGLILVRYTLKEDEQPYSGGSRATNFLHKLIGEGNETYKEHSVLLYLLPLAVVFVNGAVLGIFSVSQGLAWKELSVYLAYILPHGIIEIPAVILAATLGYTHALRLNAFLDAVDLQGFFQSVRQTLRSVRSWGLFSVVIVMLVSAAGVETYITPGVGRNALRNSYFSLELLNQSVGVGETAFAILRAAFGSRVTFHRDSPSGPPLPVRLVGNNAFEVGGRLVPDPEIVVASELTVPENVLGLVLEFNVENITEILTVHIVAEYGKFRDEGNLTVSP